MKNKFLNFKTPIILSLGIVGHIVALVIPQHAFSVGVFFLSSGLFFYPFSFEKGAGIFLFFLSIWAMDTQGCGEWVYITGKCVTGIIPVTMIRCSTSFLTTKIFFIGYWILLLNYIDAIQIYNPAPYWFLRALAFPTSVSLCMMHWKKIETYSIKIGKRYLTIFSINKIVSLILLSFLMVLCFNLLNLKFHEEFSGLKIKHRVMYFNIITFPFVCWLMDKNYKKQSLLIFTGILCLNIFFECRLGAIGILLAMSFRYFLLKYPKIALWTLQIFWGIGAISVTFLYSHILKMSLLKKIVCLNSSFYERWVFWNVFNKISDSAFWFGLGFLEFFRILSRPLLYEGIKKGKILKVVPSHTHCLWLDLKLCGGCVGIAMISLCFLFLGIKNIKNQLDFFTSFVLGVFVYTLTIYISFFGIFSHFFVLGWATFSLIIGKVLYCSTWNKVQK
ncbi:hypothetical protein [Holospora obtusa]|nr:hypothetical protein [Holospora obtusa]